MPELPEVETVRAGLACLLPNRTIAKVTVDTPRSFPNDSDVVNSGVVGARVESLGRRGKIIIIDLSTSHSLLIHLKMTGQLVFREPDGESFGAGHPTDSLIGDLPDKSTRVIFDFVDGSRLFFNDQRKFGWIKLMRSEDIFDEPLMSKLGPEILSDDFSFDDFLVRVRRRPRSSIKSVILDQSILAGVGNIYADEGLFSAGIHPSTPVEMISSAKLRRLYVALRKIMKLSISLGGSTDRNYVDALGRKGNYLAFAKVFRREGQPCSNCGAPIEKIRVAGRGTHICKKCQPEARQ